MRNTTGPGTRDGNAPPASVQAIQMDGGALSFTLKNYGGYALELLGSSVVINAIALGFPIFSMVVYNKVIGNRVPETLWAMTLGVLLLCSVELILRGTRAYFVEHISTRWDHVFDQRVLAASVRAPLEQVPDVGVLMHRYRDTLASRDFLSSSYVLGLADIPFLPLYFLLLALVGSWIAVVPLAVGIALYAWVLVCHKVSHAYMKASLVPAAQKMSVLSQSVMASEVLRLLPGAGGLVARLNRASTDYSTLMARSRYWGALSGSGMGGLMSLASVATIVIGVYLVEAQAMSMGALIASSTLVSRTLGVIHAIANASLRFSDFKEALQRLEADLPGATAAQEPMAAAPKAPSPVSLQAPAISLERASYRYHDDGRSVLSGIDLQIAPGERIALVGRAGSGKSTLLRILAGLVLPSEGQLLMDYSQLTRQNIGRLRGLVGLKPQDGQLLDGTLLMNVASTEDKSVEPTVVQLLREVGFASALQSGELALNTLVGEQGRRLSGGQRQMVAFARAMFQMRPVLILDEPTLGLDQISQAAVMRTIAALPRSVTVIVATHSAELLQLMDRVVAIDAGRKVADGPRESLFVMANQGRQAAPSSSVAMPS